MWYATVLIILLEAPRSRRCRFA